MKNSYKRIGLILLFIILNGFYCSSSQKMTVNESKTAALEATTETPDPKTLILTGWLEVPELLSKVPGCATAFEEYQPNAVALAKLKECETPVEITVVLGTWCSDTARELPRFLQTIKQVNNSNISVRYFGVNRGFRDKDQTAKALQIIAVPTFIITSGAQEIGRIIETPELTIEEDLAMIIAPLKQSQ